MGNFVNWSVFAMKLNSSPARSLSRLSLSLSPSIVLIFVLLISSSLWVRFGSPTTSYASPPAAGESCATSTVINPASLPFSDEATTVGALNDIDPGPGGCAPGPGSDVVYSFTPSATDTYAIGATPLESTFDLSLYVVTNCANPASACVAGANTRPLGKGESLVVSLTAGTQYFIVVDNAQLAGEGQFHFSLRRGVPANDGCATPTVIESNRLPFTATGTTFGAANNLNPGAPCVTNSQSASGADVVYQFTSPDTQNYDVTVTPNGNYDVTIYIVTNCVSLAGCSSADIHGSGDAENLRRNLAQGQTFFIIVDGFQGDAGDFTIQLVPTIPRTPAPATNLAAVAVSSTQINLMWSDNSIDEQGFRIDRSLDGTNFAELATVNPNVTTFSDTGLTPNTTYFYRVLAFNNFGNSAPSNIAADTTPIPPIPQEPAINVSPVLIEFGSVRATTPATRTVTVSNVGAADLVITTIAGPFGPFSLVNRPTTPFTLATDQSVTLTVQFIPTTVGNFGGSFSIQSNDPDMPSVIVTLSGTGTAAPVPNLEVSPVDLNFQSGSSVSTLELRNTGEADLLIASIQLPTAPFSVSGTPGGGTTLKSGERLLLTVSFSPTVSGVFTSRITVVTNDPDALVTIINLRGTSTPQNEQFKLRAPAQFTAIAGASNTINVVAVNGTNSDIHLSATSVAGGTFTDRGNGRGDLVINPTGATGSTLQVLFTATDGQGRTKTIPTIITIVSQDDRVQVAVGWSNPTAASGPPINVTAIDLFITPLVPLQVAPAPALDPDGRVAFAIYRETVPGISPQLSSLVAIVSPLNRSFTDNLLRPANGNFSSFRFFYTVTAIYSNGTESVASNESSTEPRMVNLDFKSKRVRFDGRNSNVSTGAVLVVDGTQTFTLERDGDLIVVKKNSRSTPGNLRPRDIFKSNTTHLVFTQNQNGQTSRTVNLSR